MRAPSLPTTAAELIDLFLASTAGQVSEHCHRERTRTLRLFADAFGPLPLAELRAYHLALWLDQHSGWRADWQRKRVASYVKRAWNWAEQLDLVSRNPFRSIKLPNGQSGQPMQLNHFQALLRHAPPDLRRILLFLRYTGCRPGELRTMQWPDVRWDQCLILLNQHKTQRVTRRPRAIYLHPSCQKMLRWMFARRRPEAIWVFPGPNGMWSRYYLLQCFRVVRRKAGLPATVKLYGLRHLFGTQAVLRGLDLKTISELLGHTTTRMTEYYLHLAANGSHLEGALRQIFRPDFPRL